MIAVQKIYFLVQGFGKFKVTHFQNSDHILIDRSTWEEITALKKSLPISHFYYFKIVILNNKFKE